MGRIAEVSSVGAADAQVLDPFLFVDFGDSENIFYAPVAGPFVTVRGSISVGTDQDFYQIRLRAGDRLVLDIDYVTLPTTLDTVLNVSGPGGTAVAFNDDQSVIDPGSATGRDSFLDLVVATTGIYTIAVTAFGQASIGDYALRVIVQSAPATLFGTTGADVLRGSFGADTITGFDSASGTDTGNDTLSGVAGADRLDGGGGNDLLDGGQDGDILLGGTGNDTLNGGNDGDLLRGGAGDDSLSGDGGEVFTTTNQPRQGGDRLFGGAGNDTVEGGRDGDYISGGDGNDLLSSFTVGQPLDFARDIIDGGAGNDTLLGDEYGDVLFGGDGDDRLVFRGFGTVGQSPFLDGGDGFDTMAITFAGLSQGDITFALDPAGGTAVIGTTNVNRFTYLNIEQVDIEGGNGNDRLTGGVGNDTLSGSVAGSDLLIGGDGDDSLDGGLGGIDTLLGGAGNDALRVAGGFSALLDGGSGNDTIDASGTADAFIFAGSGNDRVLVTTGNFVIDGGSGTDALVVDGSSLMAGQNLSAETFSDGGGRLSSSVLFIDWDGFERVEITAGAGNDTLNGTAGADLLLGSGGADALVGAGGADTLDGGSGIDTLTGGAGNDVFRIRAGQGNGDRIADFVGNGAAAGDRIELIGYGAGATLVAAAGVNKWKIDWAGADEIVTVIGALVPSDYSFV